MDTTSIDHLLNPPEEVSNLIGMAFGVGWGVTKLADFSEDNTACDDLNTRFNSDKDFVVVSVTGQILNAGKLLAGDDAEEKSCKRDRKRCNAKKPLNSKAKKGGSTFSDLVPIFPICLAIRPCNDADQILKQIRFGFVSGGNSGGDGILIFMYMGVEVYFQGLAFDTAGTLAPIEFSAPLIDPINQATTSPKGMHFWLQCKITFPVNGKVKGKLLVV